MDEDSRDWLDRAAADLEAARYNLDGGLYPYAAFLAQQAAEKALESLAIAKGHALRRTHDLVALARPMAPSPDVLSACEALNPHYIESRYPTGLNVKYSASDGAEAVNAAEVVIDWVRLQT